ncbi:ABC transporter ATP-binding protein [Candidatus Woesebacteria bacterium]|nr:ABC transporter ATP-binding protein [Candidatus Woesebacteria bacterium]QQG47905.1 MAG: ABC transporter ATP-binding protein [Candidatus Woesebacteria bacterium]
MGKIIDVSRLVKKYNKANTNAVDDITFDVSEGEFFSFLGPNGAGKTTTISILTTTLSKTSGKVSLAGYDLDKNQKEVRKSIGIIFQNPSLDQNLTAEENVRFHAILYGIYPFAPTFGFMSKAYQKKVYELSEILGIQKDIFKPIKTFSGGMKRKLEIMRSLIHKPKILFLDEPTSGLDPLSRKNLWQYLNEVRKSEKTTIFLTTHYLEEAEGADHVFIINKGKIVSSGTPSKIKKELIKNYLLVDSKSKRKLISELKKLKLNFEEKENIMINLRGKNPQKVISSIKTPLNYLDIHNPTLEDAYLEIIENNNHA